MSPAALDELRAGFEQPFWALGRDGARDGSTVVISWPAVPIELVRAAGLAPVFARGSSALTPAADRVLEPELFPNRLRQLIEAALTGRLANVATIVLPRSSDADYKCFLYLRELARRGVATSLPPVLLFDLLHTDGEDARAYNSERTRELHGRLASLAGRTVTVDDVRAAVAAANRARAAARRLHELRHAEPRIAGVDALPLLGAYLQLDPERYTRFAAAVADTLATRPRIAGVRVLLAGVPVDSTALHAAIESRGGVVITELSPYGANCAAVDVDVAGDPFVALAEHCRHESIDARMPVAALARRLDDALVGARAVVVSLPPDDASFGWDYPRVRSELARRGLPHVVVAAEPTAGVAGADGERIAALLGGAARTETVRHG